MSDNAPQFPAYGDRGDVIGARRARWSFRFCVTACILLAGVLWYSEYFIRFDRAENLYLSALAHHTESARPLLRQAVMRDEAAGESPNPRYVQALAERELRDMVLPTYQKAYELDPGNAALAIRYGCNLFLADKFDEARQRFRDAAQTAPENALPRYLEATTIPWTLEEEPNILRESLKLIAQANGSGKQIVFPRPLWHPKLPAEGRQYAKLRRELVDECVAPLNAYKEYITGVARRSIEEGRTQYWDSWLQTLERAGEKLARNALPGDSQRDMAPGSAPQAMAGLDLQLQAVRLRQQVHEIEEGVASEDLARKEAELENALSVLREFENSRQAVIERDASAREFAVFGGPFFVALALGLLAMAGALAARLMRSNRNAWAIAHGKAGGAAMLLVAVALVAFLALMPLLQSRTLQNIVPTAHSVWLAVLIVVAGGGVVYPVFILVNPRQTAASEQEAESDAGDRLAAARSRLRGAYVVMIRRFYGVTLGLFLAVFALWAVAYRLLVSLYPWQIELLATGMSSEEAQAVRQALSLLH